MQIKIINGFRWGIVTNKAKEIYNSGIFPLYALHEDGSESLIEDDESFNDVYQRGLDFGIEIGGQPTYKLTYTTEVQANTPEEAAEKALALMKDGREITFDWEEI